MSVKETLEGYTVTNDDGPASTSGGTGTGSTSSGVGPTFDVDAYRKAQEAYYNSYGYQSGQSVPKTQSFSEPLSDVLARQQLRNEILALLPEEQREIAKQFLLKKDLDPFLRQYFTVTSDDGATSLDPNITPEEARAAAEEIVLLPEFQAKLQRENNERKMNALKKLLPWIAIAALFA